MRSLTDAIWADDAVAVEERLKQGKRIDWGARQHGDTRLTSDDGFWAPLHHAARWGHAAVAKVLLQAGDAQRELNRGDKAGRTPLHWAVLFDHLEVAKLLLEAGADVNHQSNCGSTPLVHATRWGYLDVAKLLTSYGATSTDTGEEVEASPTPAAE
jgi:ankyrin repeat protein